jgi:hypothetical protein
MKLGRLGRGRGRGRPTLPEKKDVFSFRLTPGERGVLVRAAEAAGLDVSAWCRKKLLESARSELDDAGHFRNQCFQASSWLWFWHREGMPRDWRATRYGFEPGDGLVAEDL